MDCRKRIRVTYLLIALRTMLSCDACEMLPVALTAPRSCLLTDVCAVLCRILSCR